jgi:hypothetical protein
MDAFLPVCAAPCFVCSLFAFVPRISVLRMGNFLEWKWLHYYNESGVTLIKDGLLFNVQIIISSVFLSPLSTNGSTGIAMLCQLLPRIYVLESILCLEWEKPLMDEFGTRMTAQNGKVAAKPNKGKAVLPRSRALGSSSPI